MSAAPPTPASPCSSKSPASSTPSTASRKAATPPRLRDSPLAISGVFSGALKLLSPSAKACFQYRLHPPRKGHDTSPIVIDFSSLPAKDRAPDCQYTERTSGKALIDPASMRIVHIETHTAGHEMLPGVRGDWDWSIDFTSVALNGKTFWLPSSIRSTAITEPSNIAPDSAPTANVATRGATPYSNKPPSTTMASKGAATYHLLETFTGYHLLTVESRIVPASDPLATDTAFKPAPSTLKMLWKQVLPGASVLEKSARLIKIAATQHENNRELIELRCDRGASIVRKLGLRIETSIGVRHLDEHWDGGGYPQGLKGDAIPIISRLMAVAQHLDAFCMERGPQVAIDTLVDRSGRWFDPDLTTAAAALDRSRKLFRPLPPG